MLNTDALRVIHHLGGTSKVAAMIEAPISTVHSWRKIGIPSSRMAHLRLVALAHNRPIPDDVSALPLPTAEPATEGTPSRPFPDAEAGKEAA